MLNHSKLSSLEINSISPNTATQNKSTTDCNTSVFKRPKSLEQIDVNQAMGKHAPLGKFKNLCNLLKISNNHLEDASAQYPLINKWDDECQCEKIQYEPFEEFSCTCKETNATCQTFDLVPHLNISAMRYNEYYISVSSTK